MFVGAAQSLGIRTSPKSFDPLCERTATFCSELTEIIPIEAKMRPEFA